MIITDNNITMIKIQTSSIPFIFFVQWNQENGHPSLKEDPCVIYYEGKAVSNFWNFCGVEIDEIGRSYLYHLLRPFYADKESVIEVCKEVEKKLWEVFDYQGDTE